MKKIMLFVLIFQITSCMESNKTDQVNQFDIEKVRKIISDANKVYGDRFTTKDSAWYVDKYCKNACAMPEKMSSVCGIDSIIKYYYNDGNNKDFKIIIKEIDVYGNQELVVEEGIYDFPDGKGGSFDKGKFIAIWKFEDNKWKIYREIWNSSVEK